MKATALGPSTVGRIALLFACLFTGCNKNNTRAVLLIADAGNGRIVQTDNFNGAGWTACSYPRVNTNLISPVAVAVDSMGRIYAVNTADDNISRMDDILSLIHI